MSKLLVPLQALPALLLVMVVQSVGAAQPGARLQFTPTLELQQVYDDNYLAQPDDKQAAWLTLVTPGLGVELSSGASNMIVHLDHTRGVNSESSSDNFADNRLRLASTWQADYRHRLKLDGYYLDGHESRGTGVLQGRAGLNADELVTFTQKGLRSQYDFGATGARGQLSLRLGYGDRRYTNYEALTDRLDHNRARVAGLVFFRLASRTRVLLHTEVEDVTYTNFPAAGEARSAPDHATVRALIGFTRENTGDTVSTVKLGGFQKKFAGVGRGEFTGTSWEADVKWLLTSYSSLTLFTERASREPYDTADNYIDAKLLRITWNHQWAERLSSSAEALYEEQDYESSAIDRRDKISGVNLELVYQPRHWLKTGVRASHYDRVSNLPAYEYQRNRLSLRISTEF